MPPLNLVGDFGGGALYLAFGMLAGLLEARASGKGQVVDCAMVEGAASLMTAIYGCTGRRPLERASAAATCSTAARTSTASTRPRTASTSRIGSIEPQFYALLLREDRPRRARICRQQMDRGQWPEIDERLTRHLQDQDARRMVRDDGRQPTSASRRCCRCREAMKHPHNTRRGSFVTVDGIPQPAPAPRFSRTPSASSTRRQSRPAHRRGARRLGFIRRGDREKLRKSRAVV